MANPDHRKICDQGVATWNNWRERDNIVPGLSGDNFVDCELDGINFDGTVLHSAVFNAAKMKGARFVGAKLI